MCTAKPRPVIRKFQVASEAERIARDCGFRHLPGGKPSEMESRKIEIGEWDANLPFKTVAYSQLKVSHWGRFCAQIPTEAYVDQ